MLSQAQHGHDSSFYLRNTSELDIFSSSLHFSHMLEPTVTHREFIKLLGMFDKSIHLYTGTCITGNDTHYSFDSFSGIHYLLTRRHLGFFGVRLLRNLTLDDFYTVNIACNLCSFETTMILTLGCFLLIQGKSSSLVRNSTFPS
jgi:hypothetical protein